MDTTATAFAGTPGSWHGHWTHACGAAGDPDGPVSEHGAEVDPASVQIEGLSSTEDQPIVNAATRASKAWKLPRTGTANILARGRRQVD